jgi:hypothetical protein
VDSESGSPALAAEADAQAERLREGASSSSRSAEERHRFFRRALLAELKKTLDELLDEVDGVLKSNAENRTGPARRSGGSRSRARRSPFALPLLEHDGDDIGINMKPGRKRDPVQRGRAGQRPPNIQ